MDTYEETCEKKFRIFVDNKIAACKLDVMQHGGFCPLFLALTDDGMKAAEIDLDVTSKDDAAKMIKGYCAKESTLAAALLFTAETVSAPVAEAGKIPQDLKEAPNMKEAIMGYLYTKESTYMRRIIIIKEDSGSYIFQDITGWEKTDSMEGRFANPFLTGK